MKGILNAVRGAAAFSVQEGGPQWDKHIATCFRTLQLPSRIRSLFLPPALWALGLVVFESCRNAPTNYLVAIAAAIEPGKHDTGDLVAGVL